MKERITRGEPSKRPLSLDTSITWASMERALKNTYGGRIQPLNTATGWSAVVVGSGATAYDARKIRCDTGTTANSSGLLSLPLTGLNLGAGMDRLDWTKPFWLRFAYATVGADTEKVARVQIKAANTIGALADQGIELLVTNVTPSLETYGTSGDTAASGVTFTNGDASDIVILHLPSTGVKLYINQTLRVTQSTSGKYPSAIETAQSFMVHSIANGATGTVADYSYVIAPEIWQGD